MIGLFSFSNFISLDLSNFDTSKVVNMSYMFSNCIGLISLNISNFDTSNVIDMSYMFYNCKSLTYLNPLNFATLQVKNMSNMFYNCTNLNFLNLSNFDTSNVDNMNHMFYNCSSIKELNLFNFYIKNVKNFNNMFYGCLNLEYIYLYIPYINLNSNTEGMFSLTSDNLIVCGDNGYYKFRNILPTSKIYKCNNSGQEIKYICYMKNTSLFNKYICDICKKKMILNFSEYDDNNTNIGCYELKNNSEIELTDNYSYESNILYTNLSNYYNNPTHTKYDTDIFLCNSNLSLTSNYYYSNEIEYDFSTNNIFQIENKNEIMKNVIANLIEEFDVIELNNGKDKKITEQNKEIILTSTLNQKINEQENYISMNLGDCENKLKSNYKISNNDPLYILQIISEEEGMKIPKVEYEVYYPLNNINNLTKLNLSFCKDIKIEISISVVINESIDKYDPKSDYYNDICTKASSESGTDISLKDRKNEFVKNNMSLCEENCELIEYNPKTEKAKCFCDVKLSIPLDYDIKFNKNDFFKSFTDIENIFNIIILKCYRTVIKIKGLMKNYGFFIIVSVIVFYFIVLIIFITNSFSKIKKEIYNIIFESKIQGNPIKKKKLNKSIKNRNIKANKSIQKNDIKMYNNKDKKNKKVNIKDISQKIENNKEKLAIVKEDSYNKINTKQNRAINERKYYINAIMMKKDFELNSLNYEEAFKLDHRNYFQYYLSLLKNNHPIFFSFGFYNDYNSKIIKIFLFLFSLCFDLVVNALFFNDDTMHKIYEDKGSFNFLYQIPQILYSTLISRFFDTIIKNLALSQDNIVDVKQEIENRKDTQNLKSKYNKLLRTLKIKFILFFIFAFILLIFLAYYLTCFCGVYVNTQIHLFKDWLISLILSLLIPFGLCLIPGILRISSLRADKPNRKLLYKLSSIFENWFC